jgi:hypothetical protein
LKYTGVGSAKTWATAGVGFSIPAFFFCLLGAIQGIWLSATPNFPQDRAVRNVLVWGLGAALSVIALIVSVIVLRKHPGR